MILDSLWSISNIVNFFLIRIQIALLLMPSFVSQNTANGHIYPASNYMFKVNNRGTITRCETCSKLTIKTSERHHWCRSGVFIVNFEHILHLVLVFLLLTLKRQMPAGYVLTILTGKNCVLLNSV